MKPSLTLKCLLLSTLLTLPTAAPGAVVINEIYCDSEPNPVRSEFIELFNDGLTPVNIGGWRFSEGIQYTFPSGTVIPAGGYLVIPENLAAFQKAYGPQSKPQVIAHWNFDETSGDRAADSSGSLNGAGEDKTAVASGGVQQNAEGKFGGSSIAFDGASGSYLTIPHLDGLWSGSYTIAAWVKPADRTVNAILADNQAPQSFMFSVDTAVKMTHRYASSLTTTQPTWAGSGGTTTSNAWQHVAAVWDQDAQIGRIYLDGVLVYKGIAPKMPVELKMVRNARPWHIGRNQANNECFNGLMDELWVIQGALPGSSINTLMTENRLVQTEVIDLADIVGGGDGSLPGTGVEQGINPTNGQIVPAPLSATLYAPSTPGAYSRTSIPFIDGVFVPDGTLTNGQIISSTSLSATLRSGDNDPSPGPWYNGSGLIGDPSKVNNNSGLYIPKYLDDPFRHSMLSAMTQKGITFDLDAISASRGGRRITGFTAVAADSRMQPGGNVSAIILVDGIEKFRQTNISSAEQIIDLSLPSNARFLTLVLGNSDRNNTNDHGYFADPFLHIEADPLERFSIPVVGPYSGALTDEGEKVVLRNSNGVVMDEVDYRTEFPWPVGADGAGRSLELQNSKLDNDLAGSWRSSLGSPTPGRRNSVYTENPPPQIRQVAHLPKAPNDSQSIQITAKVTDPQGVAQVQLHYQLVFPGRYIPAYLAFSPAQVTANPSLPRTLNPAFEAATNWVTLTMVDDGTAGDSIAGDSIFTAVIPKQPNRTLVRYRITATDRNGSSIRVPYEDDPSLNFAAYVYNGIPDFIANTRSVTGTIGYVHSKDVMSSVPVYSLLTDANDFSKCVAYNGADQLPADNFESREAFNWNGTFVYEGEVYDHIRYRLRQRNDRYGGSGKRSFRFRFNRGHYAQFKNIDGEVYPQKWRTLNSHKMSARGGPNMGLPEMCNSQLWALFGVPAPSTHWFHLRVVDGADEAPTTSNGQHLGDFYGMMLGLEDYDSRFLTSHDLPEGNIYKLNSYILNGKEVQRYQASDSVEDASDFYNILTNLRPERNAEWLNTYVDYPAWYRYHTVVDAVRHYDVAPNTGEHLKNRSWYFRPDPATPLGKLMTLPWDSDTSWGPNWNGGEDFSKFAAISANKPDFVRDYKNVVREFRDLIWQRDQIEPMLDRFDARISPFQLADRDRWTGAPAVAGSQSDPAFSSKIADMKKFAFIGGTWEGGDDPSEIQARDSGISGKEGRDAYLDWLQADAAIPETPTVTYVGPAGFPANGLVFNSSAFQDPQGANTFQAMEWRIAEYLPNAIQKDDEPIIPPKSTWKYHDLGQNLGTAWRESNYDDSSWASGKGDFGYGESGLGTTNSWGTVSTNRHLTYYYRKQFTLSEPERFTGFRLGVRRDDGAVVYLNGKEIFRTGMPAAPAEITFNTRATADQNGSNETTYFPLVIPLNALLPGANTIAVEVHQFSANNSDLRFDLTLSGIYPAPPTPTQIIWEYNHRWKSPLITPFNAQISIPPSAVRENRNYRVRVRHLDDSGRWSHWSSPVEFVTSPPSIQPLLENLEISEIMYNPAGETPQESLAGWRGQDFEYVELHNRSLTLTLDLTDVRFTQGIDASIAPGTLLPPNGYAVVARSKAALTLRHSPSVQVIGEFTTSRLDNGGEPIKLSYGGGLPIREFRYDDDLPWPVGSSSSGQSISFLPGSPLPSQGDGLFWRSTPPTPGQPNNFVATRDSWLAQYFKTSDPLYASKTAWDSDPDGDGQINLVEYVLGSSPVVGSSLGHWTAELTTFAGVTYLTVSYLDRSEALVQFEASQDLTHWTAFSPVETGRLQDPDNATRVFLRDVVPWTPSTQTRFIRLKISSR